MGRIVQIVCVAIVIFPAVVRANDSSALLEAGGIVLTTSSDVTMESEDLTIGRTRVRVSYVFRNTGTKEVRTRVAFPVPPIPVCAEEDMGECDGDIQISKGPNPMGFKLWVDGKASPFETEEKTSMGKGGVGTKTITHHWEQTFPAQKLVTIAHEYTPVAGGFFTGSDDAFKGEMAERYCVGPKLMDAIVTSQQFIWAVHYILKTGANWKGPIGKFKLTIVKETPRDKVSVCLPDTRRVSPTTFEVTRSDFVPDKDLKILFIPAVEPANKALQRTGSARR
jgi:uncharacterized protein DUF4424